MTLGRPGSFRIISPSEGQQISKLNSTRNFNSPLPYDPGYLQFLGIRTWTSLGDRYCVYLSLSLFFLLLLCIVHSPKILFCVHIWVFMCRCIYLFATSVQGEGLEAILVATEHAWHLDLISISKKEIWTSWRNR